MGSRPEEGPTDATLWVARRSVGSDQGFSAGSCEVKSSARAKSIRPSRRSASRGNGCTNTPGQSGYKSGAEWLQIILNVTSPLWVFSLLIWEFWSARFSDAAPLWRGFLELEHVQEVRTSCFRACLQSRRIIAQ